MIVDHGVTPGVRPLKVFCSTQYTCSSYADERNMRLEVKL
jgi:hypothetical protein